VLWSEVEDAAFAVKAGQISPIIHSPIGYHVIKVVERQTRALTPNDTAYIQQTTIEQWINRLRTNAKIEKFI
jgi:parvulin-like peptidyl-prolyl isomerase